MNSVTCNQAIEHDGFAVLREIYSREQVDTIILDLQKAFANDQSGSTLRTATGAIYGARNLLHLWPAAADVWRRPQVLRVMEDILGTHLGLVRVLYFDKPPEQSWALPWHQDRAIAVRDNQVPSEQFSKPTFKVGVPHVDAPDRLLERMLTMRLHLDDMTSENGPLLVLPGSHRERVQNRAPVTILGCRGDVLMMRPLLSHCSNASHPTSQQHRRVLHFEFSSVAELPDGFEWHDFVR